MRIVIGCSLWLLLMLLVPCGLAAENAVPGDMDLPPPPELLPEAAKDKAESKSAGTAQTPQVPAMAIQDAIEGVLDEDEPTRKRAEARLAGATEADLPVLEKYADASNPEIRRQVLLLLKKLKRGTLTFAVAYPDHTPAAQIKFNVKLYTAENAPNGRSDRQIALVNRGQMGLAKELANLECTADAAGCIEVGRFNDGDYLYVVEPQDPLPAQPFNGKVSMTADIQPLPLEVKRGVTVTVTVTDPDGQPLPDVTVYNAEDGAFLSRVKQQNPGHTRMMLGRSPNSPTNEKGVAVLEKTGLREINIVAVKDSYDCAYKQNVTCVDGGSVQVSLTMIKTVPYKCKLHLTAMRGKLPAGLRILVVRQADMMKVFGRQWNLNMDFAKIDEFIKAGAIDLGAASDALEINTELLPEQYFMVGLAQEGNRSYFGQLNVVVKDGTIQVALQDVPKPSR